MIGLFIRSWMSWICHWSLVLCAQNDKFWNSDFDYWFFSCAQGKVKYMVEPMTLRLFYLIKGMSVYNKFTFSSRLPSEQESITVILTAKVWSVWTSWRTTGVRPWPFLKSSSPSAPFSQIATPVRDFWSSLELGLLYCYRQHCYYYYYYFEFQLP